MGRVRARAYLPDDIFRSDSKRTNVWRWRSSRRDYRSLTEYEQTASRLLFYTALDPTAADSDRPTASISNSFRVRTRSPANTMLATTVSKTPLPSNFSYDFPRVSRHFFLFSNVLTRPIIATITERTFKTIKNLCCRKRELSGMFTGVEQRPEESGRNSMDRAQMAGSRHRIRAYRRVGIKKKRKKNKRDPTACKPLIADHT